MRSRRLRPHDRAHDTTAGTAVIIGLPRPVDPRDLVSAQCANAVTRRARTSELLEFHRLVMRVRGAAWALAGLIAVSAVGCAGGDSEIDSSSTTNRRPPTRVELEAEDWVLVRADSSLTTDDDSPVTLAFDDGRVSGTGPCNTYNGGLDLDGDSVEITRSREHPASVRRLDHGGGRRVLRRARGGRHDRGLGRRVGALQRPGSEVDVSCVRRPRAPDRKVGDRQRRHGQRDRERAPRHRPVGDVPGRRHRDPRHRLQRWSGLLGARRRRAHRRAVAPDAEVLQRTRRRDATGSGAGAGVGVGRHACRSPPRTSPSSTNAGTSPSSPCRTEPTASGVDIGRIGLRGSAPS